MGADALSHPQRCGWERGKEGGWGGGREGGKGCGREGLREGERVRGRGGWTEQVVIEGSGAPKPLKRRGKIERGRERRWDYVRVGERGGGA